ncbi:MAG: hypothetical protein ABF727_03695 [Gluconobacter oxydans]
MSIALRLTIWLAISVVATPFIALLCGANTRLLGPAPDRRSDDSVFDACKEDGE